MKSNLLFASMIAASCLAFIGCKDDNTDKYSLEELEEYNFAHVPFTEVGKDNYLYEVYNDNYYTRYYYNPYSSGGEFNGMQKYHGVCAGIRNGDYFGRNLDWSCGESPEFIVHTPAKDGRHATLGVCSTKMIGKIDPNGEKWMSQFLLNELTSVCYDGINDAGVCMVLLVVHYEDGNGIPTGTNPNAKQDIHGMNVIRYVLDNANSAEHAVELLNNINSFGTLEHYTFHWLLSDEKDNYFVELIGNKMAITKVEENPIEKFRKPLLTNFYMQKDTTEQHIPGGVERYDLLVKDYDKTNTADGMFEALKNIRFSRKYEGKNPATLNGEPDNNWYSEFYCEM